MDKFRRELETFVREVYEGERKVLVFGEGPLGARVMLVGEAPGEREALEGRPFVGRAGKNLDAFLEGAHIRPRGALCHQRRQVPPRAHLACRAHRQPPRPRRRRYASSCPGWRARSPSSPPLRGYAGQCAPACRDWRAPQHRRCPWPHTRSAGQAAVFRSTTPRRCSTTPPCVKYTPQMPPHWRNGWQNIKYNEKFTIFVAQTGFQCAGNVYDSTCVFCCDTLQRSRVATAAAAA